MNARKQLSQAEKDEADRIEAARIKVEISRLLSIKGIKVYLDTNILIKASGSGGTNAQQRDAIHDFCLQNDSHISDTAFWEFLRNCNVEGYGARMTALEAILGDWKKIHREDKAFEKQFAQLIFLYLYVLRNEPRNIPNRNINDLRIAAACVIDCDHLLTCDHETEDFSPYLFDDVLFDLGKNVKVHLKTFKREEAKKSWQAMSDAGILQLKFEDHWT